MADVQIAVDSQQDVQVALTPALDAQLALAAPAEAQIIAAAPTFQGAVVESIDDLSDVDTATVAPSGGQALIWDGLSSTWKPGTATVSKSLTIINPTNSEKVALFFTTTSLTLTQIHSTVLGATPSVTFSIYHGSDISASGVEVVASGITCTNTSTGLSTTVFDNPTVPADHLVWLTTTATSGTVDQLAVSLIF